MEGCCLPGQPLGPEPVFPAPCRILEDKSDLYSLSDFESFNQKSLARAGARNPMSNATASERAAMLARGIRTDRGSVATAMLTALLRSRLGFFGRVGFLDPLQLRGHGPRVE